jgi:hypothetical protein
MNRSKQRPTLPERSNRYETAFRSNGRAGNIGGISIVRAAAIKIEIAEVQNGFASIKGNGAQLGAQITWDRNSVTTVGFRLTVLHRRTALAS